MLKVFYRCKKCNTKEQVLPENSMTICKNCKAQLTEQNVEYIYDGTFNDFLEELHCIYEDDKIDYYYDIIQLGAKSLLKNNNWD